MMTRQQQPGGAWPHIHPAPRAGHTGHVLLPVALGDPLDAARYGGKAASLSTALAAGLPVPPGFALAADDVAALADREVDTAPLELALDELGGPAVAVRSSAVGEDSAGASFAGQHVSVLNVSGVAQVQ